MLITFDINMLFTYTCFLILTVDIFIHPYVPANNGVRTKSLYTSKFLNGILVFILETGWIYVSSIPFSHYVCSDALVYVLCRLWCLSWLIIFILGNSNNFLFSSARTCCNVSGAVHAYNRLLAYGQGIVVLIPFR